MRKKSNSVQSVYDRIGNARVSTQRNLIGVDTEKALEGIRQTDLKKQFDSYNEMFNMIGKVGEMKGEIKEAQDRKSQTEEGINIARKETGEDFSYDRTSLKDVMSGQGTLKDYFAGPGPMMLGDTEYKAGDFIALSKKKKEINLNKLLGIKTEGLINEDDYPTITDEDIEKEKNFEEFKFDNIFDIWS